MMMGREFLHGAASRGVCVCSLTLLDVVAVMNNIILTIIVIVFEHCLLHFVLLPVCFVEGLFVVSIS